MRVKYLHSDVHTLERVEIIRDLRLGEFDVLVGVILLREIDPNMETPAANNLVTGSSTGILFGIPMLIFIGLAPKNPPLVIVICAVYLALLLCFMFFVKRRKKAGSADTQASAK